MGGLPLEFINIQPPKRGLPLEFINQRGSASRFHQPKGAPALDFINQKGIPSTKMGVRLYRQYIFPIGILANWNPKVHTFMREE